MTDAAYTIRALNDHFRVTLTGGRVVFTGSLGQQRDAEGLMLQHRILASVRLFDSFKEGDDPYGEHDFGRVTIDGEDYLFKIDYYDKALEYGSENPADPTVTTRVMSIFRASDY